jgi:hypothetical protein
MDRLAKQAEAEYDLDEIRCCRGGRRKPDQLLQASNRHSSNPELRQALVKSAAQDDETSAVIRRALSEYLGVG